MYISVAVLFSQALVLEFVRIAFGGEAFPLLYAWRLLWFLSGLAIGYLVWHISERLHWLRFWKLATVVIGLFLVLGAIHASLNQLVFFAASARWPDGNLAGAVYVSVRYWLHFYLAWAAVILAVIYADQVRHEEVDRLKALAQAQQAQIRAFRYRIQPHFLFNAFNSIAALILDKERAAAEDMVRKLSDYLRVNLSHDRSEEIVLEAEIAQLVRYLELERTRFPERMTIEVSVDSSCDVRSILVPPFILQPLVENAVRHGVQSSLERTDVQIHAQCVAARLLISVTNTTAQGANFDPQSPRGEGLSYVRSLLTSYFGSDFRLTAQPIGRAGFCATVDVPKIGSRP